METDTPKIEEPNVRLMQRYLYDSDIVDILDRMEGKKPALGAPVRVRLPLKSSPPAALDNEACMCSSEDEICTCIAGDDHCQTTAATTASMAALQLGDNKQAAKSPERAIHPAAFHTIFRVHY